MEKKISSLWSRRRKKEQLVKEVKEEFSERIKNPADYSITEDIGAENPEKGNSCREDKEEED